MRFNGARLTAAILVTLAIGAHASIAGAAEIKVLCSNGIKAVMEELIPQFEQATKHRVRVTYGLSAALKRQIEAGEVFDLAVLTPALVDDLIKQGKVASASLATTVRVIVWMPIWVSHDLPEERAGRSKARPLSVRLLEVSTVKVSPAEGS